MFDTSFLLWFKTIVINILLPLIPGILFIRIFFGKKFQWMLLYLLSWFVGVGVVAFSLFNLQFIHFGIGVGEYFLVLWLLLVAFIAKLSVKKLSFKEYLLTLKVKNIITDIKHSFSQITKIEKIFTVIISVLGLGFLLVTLIHTSNFPTYADDSFGNWNGPAMNIYQDGGVKLFGDSTEILGRGRLGYPIFIPIYKATISTFTGGFNDIYINMWQRLVFFGMILFVFTITFDKTKNIFYSVLPVWLIVSMPLVFFHSVEWYMELPSAVYSILTIRAFWKFLEEKDYDYVALGLLLGFMLSHLKNEGLLWYFAGIGIAFIGILLVSKQFLPTVSIFIKKVQSLSLSIGYFVFFFLPFILVKWYHNLWFNQSVSTDSGLWISSTIHSEIFSVFKPIFFSADNYNVILIILALIWFFWYSYRKREQKISFLMVAPIVIFVIFVLVFLLTENYTFAMNQTTINRVFTMAFVILLAFTWLFLYKKWED